MKYILLTLLLGINIQASENLNTAKKFFDEIHQGKADKIKHLLADNIIVEDPTWGTSKTKIENALKIYESLNSGAYQTIWRTIESYEANNVVVSIFMVSTIIDPILDAKIEDRVHIMGTMISVLHFKDGKIIKHTDYGDYGQMKAVELKRKEIKQRTK